MKNVGKLVVQTKTEDDQRMRVDDPRVTIKSPTMMNKSQSLGPIQRKKYSNISNKSFQIIRKVYPLEYARWSKINRAYTNMQYLSNPHVFMQSRQTNIFKKKKMGAGLFKNKRRKAQAQIENKYLNQDRKPRFNEDGTLLRYSFVGRPDEYHHQAANKADLTNFLMAGDGKSINKKLKVGSKLGGLNSKFKERLGVTRTGPNNIKTAKGIQIARKTRKKGLGNVLGKVGKNPLMLKKHERVSGQDKMTAIGKLSKRVQQGRQNFRGLIKKKLSPEELHNKILQLKNREKMNQTQRERDISKIPFNDQIYYTQDMNSLSNYKRFKTLQTNSVKYVCGRVGKDFKDSIVFKTDIHRKRIELANALAITDQANLRIETDQWYMNLRRNRKHDQLKQEPTPFRLGCFPSAIGNPRVFHKKKNFERIRKHNEYNMAHQIYLMQQKEKEQERMQELARSRRESKAARAMMMGEDFKESTFQKSDAFDREFDVQEGAEGGSGPSHEGYTRDLFNSTMLQTDLSKSYRSQSYLNTKLDFLKSSVPQLNNVDIMGFDQLQSLSVNGTSKLKQEIDWFKDDILKRSYYQWVGKKKLAYLREKRKAETKTKTLISNYDMKDLALKQTVGQAQIEII